MAGIPRWQVSGDWFDVCKCNVPCPCTFAQTPSYGDCEGVLAWHVKKGRFGAVSLDGLNIIGLGSFKGNLWAGETKATMGMFIDERANAKQREAIQMIFGGRAGGFPAEFAKLIGEMRGIEFVPIEFEVERNLARWRAEIPGRVVARAQALTGPMTPPGKRVQTINAPGSEVGPGGVATWGIATADEVDAMGFKWSWSGRSSKHIPFRWSGPEAAGARSRGSRRKS
ncbi:MAG TPA: DUF1326 domain-containing protein [Thermoplasmata archaeon]|nr:DUF1326 domain-containing protein [Thermoplasmata archaeon]